MKFIKRSMGLIIIISMFCSCGSKQAENKKFSNNQVMSQQVEPSTKEPVTTEPVTMNQQEYGDQGNVNNAKDPVNAFAFQTASSLLKNSINNENYSPLSVYCALAVATMGSDNAGGDNTLDLLGVKSKDELKQVCDNLYSSLSSQDTSKVTIANSIWLNTYFLGKDITFDKNFANTVQKNYNTSLYSLDFRKKETGKKIEDWINDNTKGTIPPDSIMPSEETVISIMNAVHFKDLWRNPLQLNNSTKEFYTEKGKVDALYMDYTDSNAHFTKGENYTKANLYFRSGSHMVFILPNEGVKVTELLKDAKTLEDVSCKSLETSCELTWQIPKFKFNNDYDILSMIKSLDNQKNFGQSWNFNDMVTKKLPEDAAINKIIQQSYIAVDENGVEASAVTSIQYDSNAIQEKVREDMILNRPFIYEIVDGTGKILFIGICNDPTK